MVTICLIFHIALLKLVALFTITRLKLLGYKYNHKSQAFQATRTFQRGVLGYNWLTFRSKSVMMSESKIKIHDRTGLETLSLSGVFWFLVILEDRRTLRCPGSKTLSVSQCSLPIWLFLKLLMWNCHFLPYHPSAMSFFWTFPVLTIHTFQFIPALVASSSSHLKLAQEDLAVPMGISPQETTLEMSSFNEKKYSSAYRFHVEKHCNKELEAVRISYQEMWRDWDGTWFGS